MPTKYIVTKPVWHSALKQDFRPGQEIPLDHLSEEQVAELEALGVVRAEEVAPAALTPSLSPQRRTGKDTKEESHEEVAGE